MTSNQPMQSFRFKFRERRNDWRCCFCCHVRTGTIFLGIYHTLMNLLALTVFIIGLQYPEYMEEKIMDPVLPTPLSERDDENILRLNVPGVKVDFALNTDEESRQQVPLHSSFKTFFVGSRQADLGISILVTFCILILSILFLYGAVRKKASYLMPFLGFQVFNFTIASMSVIGYLCYPTDLSSIIYDRGLYPIRDELLSLSPRTLNLYIVLLLLLGMMIKAYCIGVIWSCYKYLSLQQVSSQCTIHYIEPDGQNLLHDLPDYETAMKKFPTPPPSYTVAVNENTPHQVSENQQPSFLTIHVPSGTQGHVNANATANANVNSSGEPRLPQPV